VVTLRDWLLAEAADDERRLRTVVGKGLRGNKAVRRSAALDNADPREG
jgi:hypothetical protein